MNWQKAQHHNPQCTCGHFLVAHPTHLLNSPTPLAQQRLAPCLLEASRCPSCSATIPSALWNSESIHTSVFKLKDAEVQSRGRPSE